MAANFGSDPWLDARLRNVPLPIGMLGRLSQVASLSDDQLDAAVRDVPLPDELHDRLLQLAEMPGWQRWLPEPSWPSQARLSRGQLALAASLLVAVTLGYLAAAGHYFGQGDVVHPEVPQVAAIPREPSPSDAVESVTPEVYAWESPGASDADDEQLVAGDEGVPLFPPIEFKPLPLPRPRLRSHVFASDVASDRQPPLESVIAPADRGLAPPLVAGYDLLSQIKTGERSFASPSADPQLAATLVPLRHDTATYRLAQRFIGRGRLPLAEDVRIEDFLSAQWDHYPPAENPLVIRVAAGPAPWGEPGLRLLEVGVQAGTVARVQAATDLTIAVDTSASMRHGRRLEMVRSALRQLASELKPTDRITLIGFSDDAELLVESLALGDAAGTIDRSAVERLLAAVDSLRPDDGTNVGAAIELAGAAIRRSAVDPARRRQLVLLSDGLAELSADSSTRLGTLIRSLTADGVKFDAIDVSGERELAGRLSELAEVGAGRYVQAADNYEMSAALSDSLAGTAQTVAHSASLRVAFNPQVVAAYRLVGHATTTITGPASASTQVDLHAGASTAGLFELWLLPGGGDDVATAELSWRDPSGPASQKLTQRISRLQFAKSFAESPLPLQASAIAVEAARALRNPTASGARNLGRVLELAAHVPPELQESDSFRQLVALVARAEKLRAGGRRPATGGKAVFSEQR